MSSRAPTIRVEERLARGGGAVELLHLPAALFAAGSDLRRSLYDHGWMPTEKLDAPVVSIGNLTAGGTGKTPMVAWIAERLSVRGLRPGIVSRGYGARSGDANDEALLLAELLPDVPHVLDPDRARGGRELVARGVEVVLMDDGFQHRRLQRELDLVLLDATRPWGLPERTARRAPLLPRGLLRERPAALARAHAIVLTRIDQASTASLVELRRELADLAPGVALAAAIHKPFRLRSLAGAAEPPQALSGAEVDLLSGVGHPQAFERTVRGLGARVGEHRRFPDHHAYSAEDFAGLGQRALVTTAKDAVKLRELGHAVPESLRVLDVAFELVEGERVLEALLDSLPEARSTRERAALHEGLHG